MLLSVEIVLQVIEVFKSKKLKPNVKQFFTDFMVLSNGLELNFEKLF